MQIEYRVRPVTRYIVTRWRADPEAGIPGTSEPKGEYNNPTMAYEAGYALAKQEHERLGYPPGDMRIIYPEPVREQRAVVPGV